MNSDNRAKKIKTFLSLDVSKFENMNSFYKLKLANNTLLK